MLRCGNVSDAYETLLAWHYVAVNETSFPRFSWNHRRPGEVRVRTKDRPVEVRLWQASNPAARDFRIETLGPAWQSTVLTSDEGAYDVRVQRPERGWTAYMVELTYDVGAPTKLKLTT